MTPIAHLFQKSIVRTLSLGLLNTLIIATPLVAAEKPAHHADAHEATPSASLVQLVRDECC